MQAAVDPAELKHKDTKAVVLRLWVTAEQRATQDSRIVTESEELFFTYSPVLFCRQPPPVKSLTNSSNFHL